MLAPALLLLPAPLTAHAASPEEVLGELSAGLPPLSSAALPEGITDADGVREAVGVRHLFEVALGGVSESAPRLLATLAVLFGALLLSVVLSLLCDRLGGACARVLEVVLGMSFTLLLYTRFAGGFDRTAAYLADLAALSEVAAPAMGALYLAGGNGAGAAAGGGAMAALSLLLEYLTGGALLPLLRVMLAFLLVSAVGEVRCEGLVTSLRNTYVTLLSLFCMLTSAALALGNVLGASADSLTLRSLRFAVGQMVPIVGGTVSGSLATVGASLGLVRSTAGIGVAAAVLLPLLPVAVELLLARTALSLLAEIGGLLGAATPVRILRGFRSLFDLALAAAVFSGMLFLFIAALFAACRPAAL